MKRSKWEKKLELQLRWRGLPEFEIEYRFHSTRRWRFDFAWPKEKIAVEVDGGIWTQGRHTRGKGYQSDCEKRNEAQRLGWQVYHVTPNMIKSGEALSFLERALTK